MAQSSLTRVYLELKRRKVIRVAIVYMVVAWLIVEIASVMFPGLLLPDWSVRLVIALAIIGFPIALVLAWAFELTPEGIRIEPGATKTLEDKSATEPDQGIKKEGITSVAVLPFLNLSNDPDNEYFSDGMSEELLNLLCKLPQLTVASRTSSFSFKGKKVGMGTVAKKLGVDVILEGSVRRSNDRVRITAQLIDARSDRNLWSETYNRELKDVFAVQDEIAQNIVKALELSLSPAQQLSIQKQAATEDMVAYDFYLRGRYFVERGDIDSGQKMFEKAIELDQGYALAWAGAADCHSWRCMWYEKSPDSLRKADECSLKALQLAPDQAEAHASHSYALAMNGKYAEAEAEFKAAINLDPQLYEAYYYAGRAYFAEGKFRQAADAFAQAGTIRPDDPSAAAMRTTSLRSVGTEAEIRKAGEHSVKVNERYLVLNPDDALALSRAANDLIFLGEKEQGLKYAERAYAINPRVCRYNVACAFMVAGEVERALDLLEVAASTGAVQADWLEQDSDWAPASKHPRFQAILETVRLPDKLEEIDR
jgi:adenylate cyclase